MVGNAPAPWRPRLVRHVLLSFALAFGCAQPLSNQATTVLPERAVQRQLRGHLERASGCLDEAQDRSRAASGWVEVDFRITPAGRLDDVRVEGHASDPLLVLCVRSRVVSLYFDPAPERAVRVRRTLVLCPRGERGYCPLGELEAQGASRELRERAAAALDDRRDDLERCAAGAERDAILDVELELGPDGRIMAGRLVRALPESTELRRCAVGPLLGARLTGDAPGERQSLRYRYRLGATSTSLASN